MLCWDLHALFAICWPNISPKHHKNFGIFFLKINVSLVFKAKFWPFLISISTVWDSFLVVILEQRWSTIHCAILICTSLSRPFSVFLDLPTKIILTKCSYSDGFASNLGCWLSHWSFCSGHQRWRSWITICA